MSFATHLRHAFRRLGRAPFFAAVSVATLAVGIGATAAIFTVVDAVLLEPLPYPESDRLVSLWHTAPGAGIPRAPMSDAAYLLYREESRAFEEVAIWTEDRVDLSGGERPERLRAARVTEGLLPLLGTPPALGRAFAAEEARPGGPRATILSHALWQRRFGGDPEIVGRTLTIDGEGVPVVGVMGPEFAFPAPETEIWLPLRVDPATVESGRIAFQGTARLAEDAGLEEAAADVARMIPLVPERYGGGFSRQMLERSGFAPALVRVKEDVVGDVRGVLWVLLGTVGIVLLIACANVANLFLVRAEARQREVAVRTALGAGRGEIAGGFLADGGLAAVLGGIAGLGLAWAGTRLLVASGPADLPRLGEIGVDGSVLLFTAALTALAGLVFGAFAFLRYGRPELVPALKEGGRGTSEGRERHRGRSALIVGQMALALILLVGSGLMVRSFAALRSVDPGFADPADALAVRLSLSPAEVPAPEAVWPTHRDILDRLGAIPGVEAVGAATTVPLEGQETRTGIEVEEFPRAEGAAPEVFATGSVTPGWFEAMGIPLLGGRPIEAADLEDRRDVAVVDRAFARRFWGEAGGAEAALGKRIRRGTTDDWATIVGVVGSVRGRTLDREPEPAVYWPAVAERREGALETARSVAYVVRAGGGATPAGLLPEVRRRIWSVDPDLALAEMGTLASLVERAMGRTSFTMAVLAIAAAVALFLGAVGVYGVVSYTVSRRTREIGVRMALGAERRDVARMVLRQGMTLAILGAAVGMAGAFGLTRLMASLLYGVAPQDPATYVAVTVLLALVAAAATWLPARRAAALDPLEALRYE